MPAIMVAMRDVLRLRRAIHRSIFLAPLAVVTLGACAKDDPAKTASVNVPPSGSVAALATAPSPAVPEAGDDVTSASPEGGAVRLRTFPRCPSGAFCATKTKMASFADKASAKKLDCPVTMEERDRPDALDGMARMKFARFTFDEATTQSTRADGGASDGCCYTWFIPCPGGRPLIENEQPVVATAHAGPAWSTSQVLALDAVEKLSPEAREAAAASWQRDALSEHASIASFARTTLELLAVGAPAELIVDTQRAGMDEVRHAAACFELARAFGCTETTPGPLPLCAPREGDLARLARDTFIEGCVGETVSALAATRASERTTGAPQKVWRLLAADETRHASLAWRTLRWALDAAGPEAARDLLVFARRMRADLTQSDAYAKDADDAVYSRLSPSELAEVHRDAWNHLIMPTLEALVHGASA